MKKQLEQFNQLIFELQYAETKRYSDYSSENDTLFFSKVIFSESDGLYDIVWFAGEYGYNSRSREELPKYNPASISKNGEFYEEPFNWFIDVIIDHSDKIRSLHFTNRDVGGNGTRDWNFTRLIESEAVFQNLRSFKVQTYLRGDHNTPIITQNQDYSFDDSVTQLLKKMPNLYEFEVPSPPDVSFFELSFPNLKHITVQSNYTHGNFIKNLANSQLIKQIVSLDFTDVNFDEDFDSAPNEGWNKRTPFEDYKDLFEAIEKNKGLIFKLREHYLTQEQLFELQKLNPSVQFLHIPNNEDYYVSHKIYKIQNLDK